MQDKYDITDAELEIMQVLWEYGQCDLNTILDKLNRRSDKNKNTIKTLLRRLMLKGSVESKKMGLKDTVYVPKVKKEKFLANENEHFLEKLYNGKMGNLLLNFVENKKVTKEERQRLIDILESEEDI